MSNKKVISVGLVSLGCSKNLVDLQIMAGALLSEEIDISPNPDDADVILVNTCAFIEDARKEAHDEILRACSLKENGRVKGVVVSGCLSQRYGDSLAEKYPDVDAFIGIDHLYDISKVVRSVMAKRKERKAITMISSDRNMLFEPPIPTLSLTGASYAYLKIAEGCNHACAYCAIPSIRGRLRSRLSRDIVDEASALLDAGYRELNIVAQDVTAYGRDLRSGASLAKLLRRLDKLDGDFWLRLLYGYPAFVTDELLEVIASSKHICHYIDLPIQHFSPSVLKAMRRADTVKFMPKMVERIRSICPDMALRTTCLVGFPGETEDDFKMLLDYIKEAKFDNLGVFCYSREEGTLGYSMDNCVDESVAKERRDILMAAQQEISSDRLGGLIGKEVDVRLFSRTAERSFIGRTSFQAPDVDGVTMVETLSAKAEIGDVVRGVVAMAFDYDLVVRERR